MLLKTVQWNIGGAYIREENASATSEESYKNESLEYICEILSDLQPDVITLQETHKNDSGAQAKRIAEFLGLPFFLNDDYADSHLEKGQRLGNAIISRFPIYEHKFELFYNPHYEVIRPNGEKWISHDKGITSCILALPNSGKLLAATTHITPFGKFNIDPLGEEAKDVRRSIVDKIDKIGEGSPQFLLQGDFNYDREKLEELIPIASRGTMEISTSEPTTPSGKKYDHIVFRGLDLVNFRILSSALTDHYPLASTFEAPD